MAARNFATYFWTKFESYKEQNAFVCFNENELETETFWQWTRRVRNLAIGFLDRGFEPKDRVAILCQNRQSFFDVAFATWMVGGCVVPIPSGRDRKETLRRLARSGVSAVVLEDFHAYKDLIGESTNIPPLDWIVLEDDVLEPLTSIKTIIEKGKFRGKRGDIDKLATRTFSTEGKSPALILFAFENKVHASHFSNSKLVTMMEYLDKTIPWEEETIAIQTDLSWFYGTLLGLHALIRGNAIVGGEKASVIADSLDKTQPTIIVGGGAYLGSISEVWRSRIDPISNQVGQTSGWINKLGSSVVAAKIKKEIANDFGKQANHIYIVDSPVPKAIREVLSDVNIESRSMWGRPEMGISHIEVTPVNQSLGRPVYGYACKTVGTKSEEVGEIAIRSDAMQNGYWGEDGIAEMGKTWTKFPIEGRIISGDLFLGFTGNDEEE